MTDQYPDTTCVNLEGAFDHTLDNKGRVSLPKRFRDSVGASVVVTQGTDDRFVWVFPLPAWKALRAKLDALSNSRLAKRTRRFLIGNAHEIEIDSLGRIALPGPLRDYAGLLKNVTIMGVGDTIEIWDTDRKRAVDEFTGDGATIQDAMEELGI